MWRKIWKSLEIDTAVFEVSFKIEEDAVVQTLFLSLK